MRGRLQASFDRWQGKYLRRKQLWFTVVGGTPSSGTQPAERESTAALAQRRAQVGAGWRVLKRDSVTQRPLSSCASPGSA